MEERTRGGCFCGAVRRIRGARGLVYLPLRLLPRGVRSVAWLTFAPAEFSPVAGEPVERRLSEKVAGTHYGTSLTYGHEGDEGHAAHASRGTGGRGRLGEL